jgi:hypothetical protein
MINFNDLIKLHEKNGIQKKSTVKPKSVRFDLRVSERKEVAII